MANITELKTRFLLRYDTLTNWTSANPKLEAGEIGIVAVPQGSQLMQTTPPAILFKVGPGNFNDLPYASAKAADVHSWAKLPGENAFVKNGSGNVISNITYDASLNEGQGGFKFETASVATSEGLQDVNDALAVLTKEVYGEGEGASAANSRIDQLEARMKAEEDKADNDTTYVFAQTEKGFTITPEGGEAQTISFEYLTEDEIKNLIEGYKYATAEALKAVDDKFEELVKDGGRIDLIEDAVAGKVAQGTFDSLAGRVDALDNAETGKIKAIEDELAKKATNDALDEVEGRVDDLESAVAGLSGAFQFKGTAESIEELGAATAENAGHVYIIDDLEYVSNGTAWIQLGQAGEFVLKTVYEAHLQAQVVTDQGQSDRIKAIEDDIAASRTDWAAKTQVTDPTSGDGKITVDGTEITVYTLPEDVVHDSNYKHITVTANSVSDGSTTFTKYDDAELAGKVSTAETNITNLQKEVYGEGGTAENSRIDKLETAAEGLREDVDKANTAIETLNKDANTAGSVAHTATQIATSIVASNQAVKGVDHSFVISQDGVLSLNPDTIFVFNGGGASGYNTNNN